MSKKLYFLVSIVLLLGLSGVVQAEPNDANLIGWWKFDEGTGTMVEDSSAYDNNGVTVSSTPTWVDGYPGDPCDSAMDFDGVGDGEGGLGDYVLCAEREGNNPGTYPAELMPDTFTIACWTRLDAFTYYGGFVSNGYEDGECGFYLQNGGNGNNFGMSMGTTTGWWDIETPTPVNYDTDRWYHLAATYDGQYASIYVDGELAAGPDDVSSINWVWEDDNDVNYYPSNFVIGSLKDEGYEDEGYPVDGVIDDVRFYNYALSVNDIRDLAGIVEGAATNPNPRYGDKEADMYTDLSWTPGSDWAVHDVYFGTDKDTVKDANTVVPLGVYMGRQEPNVVSNSSLVPALEFGKTYYWRIDEVNETADTLIEGRVWNFRVANYIVIDDMESYSSSNKIYDTWLAWPDISSTHAFINLETNPPYVHDGSSMSFDYDNAGQEAYQWQGSWAEADATSLPIASSDWFVADVKALVLYFYGDPGNSATVNDKMYVALDDGTTIAASIYPDINDIKDESWHEWNIDLEDFNSQYVDLTNVSKIHIGFGGELFTGQSADGGEGTVWFDDIRLWLTRCVPDVAYHYGDVTGECFIDGFDLEWMSYDWLTSDYNVMVSVPNDTNLIGWWKFDEGRGDTVEDSSAYSNDGVTMDSTPVWVEGYPNDPCDSAMYFNGIDDYLLCAEREGSNPGTYPAELMPDTFTVSCWTKLDGFAYYAGFIGSGIDGESGFYLWNTEGATTDVGTVGLSMATESQGWVDIMPTDIYEIDTWYHLAATYDGNDLIFYVDGVLVEGPQDVGGPMRWIDEDSNYPDNFTIGSYETGPAWGDIDEVRYYNYALPHGEVAYLAGLEGEQYVPLESAANLVPRVPDPTVDRQYYPENPDIVNFTDFGVLADNWLNEVLFP
jgi:hypothetical protein